MCAGGAYLIKTLKLLGGDIDQDGRHFPLRFVSKEAADRPVEYSHGLSLCELPRSGLYTQTTLSDGIEASHTVFNRLASAACAFAARCSRTALLLSSALASTGAVVLGATLAVATLGSGALAATAAAPAEVAPGAPSTEPTCVKAQLKIRWQEAR